MKNKKSLYDVIVIGAGAAGLMASASAGKRGKKVLLIEHSNSIGEKIRISGGGRCNFTNLYASSNNYLSQNPHFVKSALANYTQHDFIKLIESYNIKYHEKTLGQLFCDGSSKQIIDMLLNECNVVNVEIIKNCHIQDVSHNGDFSLIHNNGCYEAKSLIIASGGLSIPKIGATDFGYRIAKKFGLKIIPPRPALVPITINKNQLDSFVHLSGISNLSIVKYKNVSFKENILFTHKGMSGPAILQISSYLEKLNNEIIYINLLPEIELMKQFLIDKNNKQILMNYLRNYLPTRLIEIMSTKLDLTKKIADVKFSYLQEISNFIHQFKIIVAGSEGFQKAEVTAGGVDTNFLSSKTMACNKVPNLYFIGEVVDVTGWLGGYNFQWAWSSGFVAGNNC